MVGTPQAQSILITGASSGIGRGLASSYAAPGVRLALVGRNAERLAETAARCEAQGATVTCGRLDVRDRAALAAWILAIDDECSIDIAIACAGTRVRLYLVINKRQWPGDLGERILAPERIAQAVLGLEQAALKK